jgi:hypothetical protein
MLYHREKYLPNLSKWNNAVLRLRFTNHAEWAAKNDRYGVIDLYSLPRYLVIDTDTVVEAETNDKGVVVKLVLRLKYDGNRDVVVVVMVPDGSVKTVWFNKKDDTHKTLDLSKYSGS